jgi:ParB family chromosome partitioning protein
LDALLGSAPAAGSISAESGGAPTQLPLTQLQPGRYQPRTRMDEAALQELAASIRTHGVMQPVVVRPLAAGRWEIIAGERRCRAARLAGLESVPVIVREVGDEQALALALIENIQREDLNALEEAQAVERLIREFGYTHEQCAEAIGRSRSATSNLLRLLNLAAPVQTMLLAGDLDMGHARALLALSGARQIMVASEIHARRLSVREAERLAARHAQDEAIEPTASATGQASKTTRRSASSVPDRDVARLADQLSDLLGTRVEIRNSRGGSGTISVRYVNAQHFDTLLARLNLAASLEASD